MLDLKAWIDKVTNALKTDYVVEQGTSNGWTYRKWLSGIAECWYKGLTKSSQSFASWGSLYYGDWATGLQYPFAFISAPALMVTPADSQAYVLGRYNETATEVGTIRLGHNNTTSVQVVLDLYAIGRWQ